MSWFRKALSICTPDPGSYYTVVDPLEFYEWRFTGTAPKDTKFTSYLPPSDIFTKGQVIASAIVPEGSLTNKDNHLIAEEQVPVSIILRVGSIPTAQELIENHERRVKNFNNGIDRFREDAVTRRFLNSQSDTPNLYKITNFDEHEVTCENFGPISDLLEKFTETRELLRQDALKKKGRALEMEEFRRYENVMDFVNNSHLHVDASKMDKLLYVSDAKSKITKKMSWKDCYIMTSPNAKLLLDEIGHFNSFKWVKAFRGL